MPQPHLPAPLRPAWRALQGALQRLWAAAGLTASTALDPPAHARLLAMLASRVSAEIAGLVIAPVLIWVYAREQHPARLIAWASVYGALCALALVARRRFQQDQREQPAGRLVAHWLPRFRAMGLALGASLGALPWVAMGAASHEFATLVYLVSSAVVAATAVRTAPVFSVFLLFFAGCWGAGTAAVWGMFPQRWPWVLPLQLVYGLVILRHAATTHRFVVEQLRLQARSAQLAQSCQQARDDAERALQARGELLMRASHDLRQPVHALAMIADVLARRSTDAALAPALGDLKTCVHTLHQMFESLMDLAQLESGTLKSRPAPCRLRSLLAEADAQFRGEALARQLQWRVRWPAGDPVVVADPVLLRRALFNLVHNALHYTHRGGVLLAVRRRAGEWRMEVRDTGVGVAEEDLGHIYSPFFRHADAVRSDGSGHGLGLAVFAECVALMGARSGLASTPGRGSCFWLSLAAVVEVVALPSPGGGARRGPPGHRRRPLAGHCLIVESPPALAGGWPALLAGWQVEGRLTAEPAQALRWLAEGFEPGAIFCGSRLRGEQSGLAALRSLMAACPSAAGVLLGGELQTAELWQAEEQGYLVLRPPVAPQTLHALLTQWLATPEGAYERPSPGAPHAAA